MDNFFESANIYELRNDGRLIRPGFNKGDERVQ